MRRIILRVLIAAIAIIIGVAAAYVWVMLPLSTTNVLEVSRGVPSENQSPSERDRPLGWDLTYTSVLERNSVARHELIWKWLDDHPQSPAKRWISDWRGEPIVSSILFEFPNPHAAERTTLWLFRTKDRAYYWDYVEECAGCKQRPVENEWDVNTKKDVQPQTYDYLFADVSSWQQAELPGVEVIPNEYSLGYMGFLSIYEEGRSRQMLLTWEDIMGQKDLGLCDTKECRMKKMGRVLHVLSPILLPAEQSAERR